jgi:glutathione S-transferase
MADLSGTHVVLRYFEMRGRAQPLRHALAAGGVAFEDVRMSLAEWPNHKGDATFAGPYGSLPTLTWDGLLVAEALPIASFAAHRLGHYRDREDDAIARFEGVCSACYLDVLVRAGELMYADLLYPGADLTKTFAFLVDGMAAKLSGVESIPAPGAWIGGESPVVADFFAAEAFEVMSYLLGPDRLFTLRAKLPKLTALAARIRELPALAREWERRPLQFTARADERVAVERIRSAVSSSL